MKILQLTAINFKYKCANCHTPRKTAITNSQKANKPYKTYQEEAIININENTDKWPKS